MAVLKNNQMKRRNFIRKSSQAALGLGLLGTNLLSSCNDAKETTQQQSQQAQQQADLFFKLSLAQWSFHRALGFNEEKKVTLEHLDFAKKARELGFEGVEYVAHFFKDKVEDMDYLKQMKQRAADNEVESLLIMIDGEGDMATKDGEETKIDYKRMLQIVKDGGYTGYIGVEYEGDVMPEEEGVIATRDLLIKHGKELS